MRKRQSTGPLPVDSEVPTKGPKVHSLKSGVAKKFIGNVIAPRPGACFRYVAAAPHGFPMAGPEPVRWRGVVTNPAGKAIAEEACDQHATGLVEQVAQSVQPVANRSRRPCSESPGCV